jgi:asparagine N-glycosylation enzyme membrane subunit Stt3
MYKMNLEQKLFGPISKKYCYYFNIMSMLAFIIIICGILSIIYMLMTNMKNSQMSIMHLVILIVTYSMVYLQNRLLYDMCLNTLK